MVLVARRFGRLRLLPGRRARRGRPHPLSAPLRADRPRPRAELRPRPGPRRRGHLPGEQVPRRREIELGRDRAHAAEARDGGGHRHPHGRDALPVSDLYNPEINVRYGSWYLRHLLDKYRDEKDALAAYNAGQQNVDRWRAEGKGIQFPETRAYVDRVEHLKHVYARAYDL